jgi:hypothetical protein
MLEWAGIVGLEIGKKFFSMGPNCKFNKKIKKSLAHKEQISFYFHPFSPESALGTLSNPFSKLVPWPKKSQDRSSFRSQQDRPIQHLR